MYCEVTLGATDVLKFFTEITGKQLRRSLKKLKAYSNFFTGGCFSNLLELSMLFDSVKKKSKLNIKSFTWKL